jgi:hypothetical protein
MKSRLEEIKVNHEFRKEEGWELTILTEDIDWLIEQAEKIEEIKATADLLIFQREVKIQQQQKEIEQLKKDKEWIYETFADI